MTDGRTPISPAAVPDVTALIAKLRDRSEPHHWAMLSRGELNDVLALLALVERTRQERDDARAYSQKLLKAIERGEWNAEYDAGNRSEHYDECEAKTLRKRAVKAERERDVAQERERELHKRAKQAHWWLVLAVDSEGEDEEELCARTGMVFPLIISARDELDAALAAADTPPEKT